MAKILVTGATGLLGVNFCEHASSQHQILGTVRRTDVHVPYATTRLDLFDEQAVERTIVEFKPDLIAHTAAMANIDECEKAPKAAAEINAVLPGKLSTIARSNGVKFIHISTDAVFYDAGDKEFTEEDATDPNSVYAQTKLDGEKAVLAADPDALVARVNFFGWSLSGTRSLSEFFFNQLSARKGCFGFTDVYFCPLFVNDLADLLIKAFMKDLKGLYHFTGSDAISKYDFGLRIADVFDLDPSLISPKSVELSTLTAKRSHNLRMSNRKLSTDLGMVIPGVSTGIQQFYTQFTSGYPQKIQSYQQK